MSKPLRVLSVDWDYFINATEYERFTMFPDGGNENLGNRLRNMIWSGRYATCPELSKITVDEGELENLQRVINHSPAASVVIADSHRFIYDVAYQEYQSGGYTGIEVDNIDYHHDYYNIGTATEVNCGNWSNAIFDVSSPHRFVKGRKYKRYRWVKRVDSDVSKELEKREWFKYCELNDLYGEPYDIIYICRSAMWSPPHLDSRFIDEMRPLVLSKSSGRYVRVLEDLSDRFTHDLQDYIKQEQNTYQRALKQLSVPGESW